MRLFYLVFALCITGLSASAQWDHRGDYTCSSQLRANVSQGMPPGLGRELDTDQLSCLGLAQVYFILTGPNNDRDYQAIQDIRAVFRREGLIR